MPMRLLSFVRALFGVVFSRASIVLIFWLVTIITTAKVMLRTSFVTGFAALVACALCYVGAAGFMGNLIERRQKGYRAVDLLVLGTIWLLVIVAGQLLMIWSGFWIRIYDVEMSGGIWALLGAVSAVVVVRMRDVLSPTSDPRR
jgi:hypothetical protein